jgi:hypothetical protein
MKANRLLLASALIALTSACVSERRPAPTPSPSARPVPRPTTPAPPPPADWRDVPLTPGDWSYRPEGATTAALYGAPPSGPLFLIRCNRASRTVTFARPAAAQQAVAMTVTTTNGGRVLSASPLPGGQVAYVAATLPASDPLLDAVAFSRGRFRVEVAGVPTLTLPSWPEIGRVIEDCR